MNQSDLEKRRELQQLSKLQKLKQNGNQNQNQYQNDEDDADEVNEDNFIVNDKGGQKYQFHQASDDEEEYDDQFGKYKSMGTKKKKLNIFGNLGVGDSGSNNLSTNNYLEQQLTGKRTKEQFENSKQSKFHSLLDDDQDDRVQYIGIHKENSMPQELKDPGQKSYSKYEDTKQGTMANEEETQLKENKSSDNSMNYMDIMNMLQKQEFEDNAEKFRKVEQHQRNLKPIIEQKHNFRVDDEQEEAIKLQPLAENQCEISELELISKNKDTKIENIIDKVLLENQDGIPLETSIVNFFLIDIHQAHEGQLFLVGKVFDKTQSKFQSCTIKMDNVTRNIYFVINEKEKDQMMMRGETHEEWEQKFCKEVEQRLNLFFKNDRNFAFYGQFVQRTYTFEISNIPQGVNTFYRVEYQFKYGPLPPDFSGKYFSIVVGTTYTAQELFILRNQIKGPGWLQIKNPSLVSDQKKRESWTAYEILVQNYEDEIQPIEMPNNRPTLRVTSISLKCGKNDQENSEIVAISLCTDDNVDMDTFNQITLQSRKVNFISIVRHHPRVKMCAQFQQSKRHFTYIEYSEKSLLNQFISRIKDIDPDVIIAHDLYSNIFDVILTRIAFHNINDWSKLGRITSLRDSIKEKSNIETKIRQVTKGRLLVDTYLSARDLVRDTDYTLKRLAERHLGQVIHNMENIQLAYEGGKGLLNQMLKHTQLEALITLNLTLKLQVLPLTKQLTNIAGNTWIRSLQNARAERNEILLMHVFNSQNYIIPDKFKRFYEEEQKQAAHMGIFDGDADDQNNEHDGGNKQQKQDQSKQYAGGLVLEPKVGLYDTFILLLDFNSLYPSIIREYNLCFSTVSREQLDLSTFIKYYRKGKNTKEKKEKEKSNAKNQNMESEDGQQQNDQGNDEEEQLFDDTIREKLSQLGDYSSLPIGILPRVIKDLVERRQAVKNHLRGVTDPNKQMELDIKQKAIKLVANSMYGCLGFENSRFYARTIAALITSTGRRLLEEALKVVNSLGFQVVYGDTDSLMINPRQSDLSNAIIKGVEIKKEINQQYKFLEMDIDGVFKSLLLLKKKKYAAIKLQNLESILQSTEEPRWAVEQKGLDIVRRDWSELSRKTGREVLNLILHSSKQSLSEKVGDYLSQVSEKMTLNEIKFDDYLITKQLNQHPKDYGASSGLPHVSVAQRLINQGENPKKLIGHIIYYAICEVEGSKNLSDRAFHASQVLANKIKLDLEYYKKQQILPPIERMCQNIDTIIMNQLAANLGLDSTQYTYQKRRDDDDQYEPENVYDNQTVAFKTNQIMSDILLEISIPCTNFDCAFNIPGLLTIDGNITFYEIKCKNCGKNPNLIVFKNKLKLYLKTLISQFYNHQYQCVHCIYESSTITSQLQCPNHNKSNEFDENLKEKQSDQDVYQRLLSLIKIFDIQTDKLSPEFKSYVQELKVYMETIQNYSDYDQINIMKLFPHQFHSQ